MRRPRHPSRTLPTTSHPPTPPTLQVILSCGAIASPQLLQLSGIGPPQLLTKLGIPLVAPLPGTCVCESACQLSLPPSLPLTVPCPARAAAAAYTGVGANLTDHLEVYHQYEVTPNGISLQTHLDTMSKGLIGARWLLRGDGLGATNHFEAGGFVRSRAGIEWPDVQFHFLPVALSYDGTTVAKTSTGHSLQMHVGYNRSPSRGYVHATAAAHKSGGAPPPPTVRFNYMSDEEDWRASVLQYV